MDRDMEKPGSTANFPKRTGCTPWSFRISAGTKLNCAFNNSGPNRRRKQMEILNFSTTGIFAILIINAPKWRRSAGIWKFLSNAAFLSAEAPSI